MAAEVYWILLKDLCSKLFKAYILLKRAASNFEAAFCCRIWCIRELALAFVGLVINKPYEKLVGENTSKGEEEVFIQKMEYVYYNTVSAGLCLQPENYKYSSAKIYASGVDEFRFLTHWMS
ncbi:hypothetical protein BH20BAC1_BH20BAC1_25930 [soil metagenome]